MSRPARRVDRQLILRALGTLGSLALLAYLLSRQGWSEIILALGAIPASSLAAVAALHLISRLAIAVRWYSLLRSADASLSFGTSLRLTVAGLFAANFLPTSVGGDVVRLAGVLRLSRNRSGAAASIVADRMVGLVGMAMLLPFGFRDLLVWFQTRGVAGEPPRWMHGPPAWAALAQPWAALYQRARRAVSRLAETLKMWLLHPGPLLAALGFTWVHMVCLFTEIWILLQGLGHPLSLDSIGGLWSLSYFITLVPLSINGLGLREVSVTYIFSELGGVALDSALTVALILRTLDVLASLPGAAFVSGVIGDRSKGATGEAG
jgi:glycosyltransferase 2 family protein